MKQSAMSLILEYVSEIAGTEDTRAATEIFKRYVESEIGPFKFLMGETGILRALQERMYTDYPDELMRTYMKRDYVFSDPVVIYSRRAITPFAWSEMDKISRKGKEIMSVAADFKLTDGYSFPILNGSGYAAAASLVGDLKVIPSELLSQLHLALIYFHGMVLNFEPAGSIANLHERLILSRRESQCLMWIADGKTDWEIGRILSIGESTVHKYVESAKLKLGSVTRSQAVVKAIKHGLVAI